MRQIAPLPPFLIFPLYTATVSEPWLIMCGALRLAARPLSSPVRLKRISLCLPVNSCSSTGRIVRPRASAIKESTAARAACLSPFHFHRGFKQAFQQTPHGYLTAPRLDRARILLQSQSSVFEACLEVGFRSPSAFCRQYRAHFGEPPSAVRRKFARSGKNFSGTSGTLAS